MNNEQILSLITTLYTDIADKEHKLGRLDALVEFCASRARAEKSYERQVTIAEIFSILGLELREESYE